MRLATTFSGSIDIVHRPDGLRIQFNCDCEDALPWCQAECCRGRPLVNTHVYPDEVAHYRTTLVKGLPLLDAQDGHCTYLVQNDCGIHATKPRTCREWHCSPQGGGPNITVRGDGFRLLPATPTHEL